MTTDARPPIRHENTWRAAAGSWSYDTWGATGRPVLFLHSLLFDRTVWWPAAAELKEHCAPLAVDLPGHGASPERLRYDPAVVVEELALLLHHEDRRHAPIVVGHGTSAGLAQAFVNRFAVHALVLVEPIAPRRSDVNAVMAAIDIDAVPGYFRDLARPQADADLLDAYRECIRIAPWRPSERPARRSRADRWQVTRLQVPGGPSSHRCLVLEGTDGLPQLSNVLGFAAQLRSLI